MSFFGKNLSLSSLINFIKIITYSKRVPIIIIEPVISQVFPPEKLKEVERLNEKASILYYQGRYEEAELFFQQTLESIQKQLGQEHPLVAISFNNLAGSYEVQRRYEEAEPLYQQAIRIATKTLGENHPNTQTIIKNYNLMTSD